MNKAEEKVCKRFMVAGRVQGVFFRASAAGVAKRLELVGHALNRTDGRVEVLVSGARENVNQFVAWLQSGPPLAQVTDVAEEAAELDELRAVDKFLTG